MGNCGSGDDVRVGTNGQDSKEETKQDRDEEIEERSISDSLMKKLLALPRKYPIKVVIDTDANNEIDDLFALSWALNIPEKFDIKGVYSAPFSFKNSTSKLLAAYKIYKSGPQNEQEKKLLDAYKLNIEKCLGLGINIESLKDDKHVYSGAEYGEETSYDKIIELFNVMKKDHKGIVYHGSKSFIKDKSVAIESDAINHLIKIAREECSSDDPLYIIGIACPTNISSAIIKAPDILDKIVVTWDASYPTNVVELKEHSLNMSEDFIASKILFDSEVALVYLPGFYIAQQLSMSYPDIIYWVKNKGELGKFLTHAFENNPLYKLFGDNYKQDGFVWIIWDLINVAYLAHPDLVTTYIHHTPLLNKNDYWKPRKYSKFMREADGINVNQVWKMFYQVLKQQQENVN